ncbi:MAG: hypothetical protein COA44_12750 [Arcobacter sp.]|nr:MAG: hypothetical protein COA44_12750 [Arcobacter sp.]
MSSFIFILLFGFIVAAVYWYVNRNFKKHETKFDDFAYKMQKDFLDNSPTLVKGLDYYKIVQDFYTQKGYSLSKHPDYSTDFIAKKENELLFIRIQVPQDKQGLTAQVLQHFIGQTVLQVIDDKSHNVSWAYVASKMLCERSAKILINSYETKLKFELIKAEV